MPEIKRVSLPDAPKIQVQFRDILQRLAQDATAATEPGGKAMNRPDTAEVTSHLSNVANLARQLDAELDYLDGKGGA
jgi:hypothetical protein